MVRVCRTRMMVPKAPYFQALTTTCRQVHAETELLPLTLNEFMAHPDEMKILLAGDVIDSARLPLIRKLRLCLSFKDTACRIHADILPLIKQLQGPRQITLEQYINFPGSPGMPQFLTRLKADAERIFEEGPPDDHVEVRVLVKAPIILGNREKENRENVQKLRRIVGC